MSVAPSVLLITSHIKYAFCPRAIGVKYFSENKEENIMQKKAGKCHKICFKKNLPSKSKYMEHIILLAGEQSECNFGELPLDSPSPE